MFSPQNESHLQQSDNLQDFRKTKPANKCTNLDAEQNAPKKHEFFNDAVRNEDIKRQETISKQVSKEKQETSRGSLGKRQ